jgi:hypothetical protein
VELTIMVGVTEEKTTWLPMGAYGTRLGGPIKTLPPVVRRLSHKVALSQ